MKSTTNSLGLTASDLFCTFLLRHRAYHSFKRSFAHTSFESLRSYLDRVAPIFFLGEAFIWDDSPEGFRYWHDLNAKWIYIVEAFNF